MADEKKTVFLKPKFQLGDRVYQQMWGLSLYQDGGEPKKLVVRAIVQTCDFDHGYSDRTRPIEGTKRIKYLTSYNDALVEEERLFSTIESFTEATREERELEEAEEAKKLKEAEIKKYKDAKHFVTEFETKMLIG